MSDSQTTTNASLDQAKEPPLTIYPVLFRSGLPYLDTFHYRDRLKSTANSNNAD